MMYSSPTGNNQVINSVHLDGSYKELCTNSTFPNPNVVKFDLNSELIWVGTNSGVVTSYFGANMERYTQFKTTRDTSSVLDLLSYGDKILSLHSDTLKCNYKKGRCAYDINFEGASCNSMMMQRDGTLLVGGTHPGVAQIDIMTQQVIRSFSSADSNDRESLKFASSYTNYIVSSGNNGQVMLREPNTFKIKHTLNIHSQSILDFDVNGNTLLSCGIERNKQYPQPLVGFFDLRMLRNLTPMQCGITPRFVRFVPSYSRRVAIFSEEGQLVVIEDNSALTATTPIYQLNNMHRLVSVDVCQSKQAIVFADAGSQMHLWSTNKTPQFNQACSYELTFAQKPVIRDEQKPIIDIDDLSVSLSSIPAPYCDEPLLSDWDEKFCKQVYRKPEPIPNDILAIMKRRDNINHAPNIHKRLLNQVPYKLNILKSNSPKDKQRNTAYKTADTRHSRQPNSCVPNQYKVPAKIPEKFKRMHFKYTKTGEEDSEVLRQYNRTSFPGLDPNLPNAYCNCMLQVLNFVEPLRCALLSHHNVKQHFDLAEELGFLFDMLDQAFGGMLQATNFLRVFRMNREANSLGLNQTKSSNLNTNLSLLIQSFNTFLLQQLHNQLKPTEEQIQKQKEEKVKLSKKNKEPQNERTGSIINQLFGTDVRVEAKLVNGMTTTSMETRFVFNLNYPTHRKNDQPIPFSKIVQNSICETSLRNNYDFSSLQYIEKKQKPCSLPEILALNVCLDDFEKRHFWSTQNRLYQEKVKEMITDESGKHKNNVNLDRWRDLAFDKNVGSCDPKPSWLPYYISIIIDANGDFHVSSCLDESSNTNIPLDENSKFANYELHATVSHITDPATDSQDGLVAHINVAEPYHKRKEKVTHSQWYLFNEFMIKTIEKEEACHFDLSWKVPCIFYYKREDVLNRNTQEVKFPIGSEILDATPSISKGHSPTPEHLNNSVALDPDDITAGMLLAFDSEFVEYKAKEVELRADGVRKIKPTQYLPGRVSVVRGEGDMEGVPIIDDYIPTQDQVENYLTKYSGINKEDLDVNLSTKHMTPFKTIYCKLKYLIHRKCVFVGHGLQKDFKVINIVVPQDQIRDTVHLFQIARKRLISLKFLCWYFLNEHIQTESHDSVVDAVTALRLYKKYLEFTKELGHQKFKSQVLTSMYEYGRKLNWLVPNNCQIKSPLFK